MNGYTKLFASILASTVWEESKETRVCWITMLAMADKFGVVSSSIPGLATLARLTIEETQKALQTLQQPDEFSRTKDFDGRRIEPCDGGWVILNHGKYRAKANEDDRREYLAEAQRKSRERRRSTNVTTCQHRSTKSTQAEAEAEAEAERTREIMVSSDETTSKIQSSNGNDKPHRRRHEYTPDFEAFWSAYPAFRRSAKGAAYRAWKTALANGADPAELIRSAAEYANSPAGSGEFAKMPTTWLSGCCWEDDRASWTKEKFSNGRSNGRGDRTLNFGPGQVHSGEQPSGIGEM